VFNLDNNNIKKIMKNITYLFVLFAIVTSLIKCSTVHSPLSLKMQKKEINVLQQIPVNDQLRSKSPLYLPPRIIKEKEFNTKNLLLFIDSMYAMMQRKAGVGISANQLGKQLQIFIIEAKADNPRYKVLGPVAKKIFINPVITNVSSVKKNFWHACLSADGAKRGNVASFEWLEYRCQDEKGNIITGRLDGFAAVIFQHEFKHMMNGTYLDVAKDFLPKAELDYQISIGKIPFFDSANDSLPLLINGYKIGETLTDYHTRMRNLQIK
jgi:peptide deformylase